jgi:hypothetical protein
MGSARIVIILEHRSSHTRTIASFPGFFHHPAGEYENKGLMIIDEEEFLLILKLKDLKKQYRNEYQELRDLRAEIQYCQRLVDQCRHRLLMGIPVGKVGRPLKVKRGLRSRLRVSSGSAL